MFFFTDDTDNAFGPTAREMAQDLEAFGALPGFITPDLVPVSPIDVEDWVSEHLRLCLQEVEMYEDISNMIIKIKTKHCGEKLETYNEI